MKNEEPGHLEVQENKIKITFGRKLKHLRQKNHLTQKELGMVDVFTVPVLSEPREYEAASFRMHELGSELN